MIERDFYNDEFEELLRDKTDQYKMYPSDRVWKAIYGSTHTRRKRFITGMSVLICSILFFAGKELLLSPAKPISSIKKINPNGPDPKITDSKPSSQINPLLAFSDLKKENPFQPSAANPEYKPGLSRLLVAETWEEGQTENPATPSSDYHTIDLSTGLNNSLISPPPAERVASNTNILEQQPILLNEAAAQPQLGTEGLLSAKSQIRESSAPVEEAHDRSQINWLAENAMANLVSLKKYKTEWQLYFSPTVNYRRISGGTDFSNQKPTVQNVPIAPLQYGSANNFVDNNPAVGFQVGGSIIYRLTRNISLRGGLQFNYSRFTLKTYTSSQPQPATIVLNSVSPYNGLPQTYTNYSTIQNFGGKFPTNLENQYFQISAPVGVEMRVIGNGRLQFNIAGSILPSYLINRNAYLLTTDYSSYTKDPSLFRKWNINGEVEAFLSYRLGAFHWQIGPQFGYQLMSTYTNKYPLKENLMEYGIKIGITKTIR
jgi:hypothetical protein